MDIQRRTLLAIVICVAIWFAFEWITPKPELPPESDAVAHNDGKKADGSEAKDGSKSEPETDEPDEPDEPDERPASVKADRKEGRIANELVALDVTNVGGMVEKAELLSPRFADPETGKGLDFMGLGDERQGFRVMFLGEDTDIKIGRHAVWDVVPTEDAREWKQRYQEDGKFEVVSSLKMGEAHEGTLTVKVTNRDSKASVHGLALRNYYAQPKEESRFNIHRGQCMGAEEVEDFALDDLEDEKSQRVSGSIRWMGLDSQYFLAALIPFEGTGASWCEISRTEDSAFLLGTLGFREATLEPGETKTYEIGVFLGTKELELLQEYKTVPGAMLDEAIDWGWFGGLNRFIGTLMLRLMRWFYALTGIWGVAILLMTVVVKLLSLPLTLKQMNSMKAMKEIQPQLTEIREKYKDDRVKQGQETQALFQRSGVNPLAGCLPMLVQMPIWIALYAMLGTAVELYREPFLWLPDLTVADPFYILPLGMGGLMFFQTRLQPAMDNQQAKMMAWMMPTLFTVMMLFLPSGLCLYIFANVFLSLIQTVVQLRPNKNKNESGAPDNKPTGADKAKGGAKGSKGSKKTGKK